MIILTIIKYNNSVLLIIIHYGITSILWVNNLSYFLSELNNSEEDWTGEGCRRGTGVITEGSLGRLCFRPVLPLLDVRVGVFWNKLMWPSCPA